MRALFKVILVAICISLLTKAKGQNMSTLYFSDGQLKAATKNTHYVDMQGSPFFFDNWAYGEAKLSDGKTYQGLMLKFDEVTQTLMFKYKLTDSTMVFSYRPVEFKFKYIANDTEFMPHFLSGFDAIDNGDTNTFYQVFNEGKIRLLKRNVKTITTRQDYGTNGTGQTVNTKTYYYLTTGKHLTRIKNNNSAILKALEDKAGQVRSFIDKNTLDMKNDDDMVKVINYYNTL